MAESNDGGEIPAGNGPSFSVTIEDCQRWVERLQRMARTLEKKKTKDGDTEHPDGIKMFYTASVLMQRLAMEIQQDNMMTNIPNIFGTNKIGEA